MGVVVRRYIDFLILLIPTPLVSALFCSSIPIFCSFKKMFFYIILITICNNMDLSYNYYNYIILYLLWSLAGLGAGSKLHSL